MIAVLLCEEQFRMFTYDLLWSQLKKVFPSQAFMSNSRSADVSMYKIESVNSHPLGLNPSSTKSPHNTFFYIFFSCFPCFNKV